MADDRPDAPHRTGDGNARGRVREVEGVWWGAVRSAGERCVNSGAGDQGEREKEARNGRCGEVSCAEPECRDS